MVPEPIRVVDLFCGAGGLSWGLVEALTDRAEDLAEEHDLAVDEALEQLVDLVAVNHWERAIETHEANHPWATHYHAKVEAVEPRSVFDDPDPDVKLLVGGPQCTHFSSARGGKPVDEQKRASPWHVLDWVAKLLPENVLLENVPEFESWGPVIDGDPTRNGQFFEAWVETFRGLGYSVGWRTLNAADYGDATSRRRLFIVARRGLQPEWPVPTHSEGGEVSGTEPWRPAAEIVDWTDPGESIWGRSRPLVNNTMRRIAEGLRRYCHDDLEPFADAVAQLEKADVKAMQEDVVPVEEIETVVEQRGEPFLVKFYGTSTARPLEEPVDTITAGGGKFGLCVPYLLGQQSGAVARDVTEKPTPTIATRGAIGLYDPQAFVLPRNGRQRGLHSNPAYDPEERPLHTVTAQNHDGHVVTPYLVQYYGQSDAVGIDVLADPARMRVDITRPDQELKRISEWHTIDPDSIRSRPEIPDLDLPCRATPNVCGFYEAIAALKDDGHDHGTVTRQGTTLVLRGHDDDVGEDEFFFPNCAWHVEEGDETPSSLFSLDYLKDMATALKRSKADRLTLSWAQEHPLMLAFEHEEWGFEGRFMLAPRIQSDD